MIQLVRRREVEAVKALMAPPESLQTALQRVQQQVWISNVWTGNPTLVCKPSSRST